LLESATKLLTVSVGPVVTFHPFSLAGRWTKLVADVLSFGS
jgi:hypothetical protein